MGRPLGGRGGLGAGPGSGVGGIAALPSPAKPSRHGLAACQPVHPPAHPIPTPDWNLTDASVTDNRPDCELNVVSTIGECWRRWMCSLPWWASTSVHPRRLKSSTRRASGDARPGSPTQASTLASPSATPAPRAATSTRRPTCALPASAPTWWTPTSMRVRGLGCLVVWWVGGCRVRHAHAAAGHLEQRMRVQQPAAAGGRAAGS